MEVKTRKRCYRMLTLKCPQETEMERGLLSTGSLRWLLQVGRARLEPAANSFFEVSRMDTGISALGLSSAFPRSSAGS